MKVHLNFHSSKQLLSAVRFAASPLKEPVTHTMAKHEAVIWHQGCMCTHVTMSEYQLSAFFYLFSCIIRYALMYFQFPSCAAKQTMIFHRAASGSDVTVDYGEIAQKHKYLWRVWVEAGSQVNILQCVNLRVLNYITKYYIQIQFYRQGTRIYCFFLCTTIFQFFPLDKVCT